MLNAITPGFIKKLDTHLLKNYPLLWTSKVHYALWHGGVLMCISFLSGMFMPVNLKHHVEYELWYFLLSVIAFLILCIWIYRYVIFNTEKNYGRRSFFDEYLNFSLAFVIVAFYLLIPFGFDYSYSKKIAATCTKEELLKDINRLNELEPYLANNSGVYFNWYDSSSQSQRFTLKRLNTWGCDPYTPFYLRGDSINYPNLKTNHELCATYVPIDNLEKLTAYASEYIELAKKYDVNITRPAEVYAAKYLDLSKRNDTDVSEFDYNQDHSYELNTVINNLSEAKFNKVFIYSTEYRWTIFYFSLSITAFLLLFKETYWKPFLITIVVLLLYPIIMLMLTELSPGGTLMHGHSSYQFMLILPIIAGAMVLIFGIGNRSSFNAFSNILCQLFYVSVPYAFLLLMSYLHDATNIFHTHDFLFSGTYAEDGRPMALSAAQIEENLLAEYWREEYEWWIQVAKYWGIVCFIVPLPLYKEAFIKQLSLPKAP